MLYKYHSLICKFVSIALICSLFACNSTTKLENEPSIVQEKHRKVQTNILSDEEDETKVSIALADAYGAMIGAKIGAESGNLWVAAATALGLGVYASIVEYEAQNEELWQNMNNNNITVQELIEDYSYKINPYHPTREISNTITTFDFSQIGINHNIVINQLLQDSISLSNKDYLFCEILDRILDDPISSAAAKYEWSSLQAYRQEEPSNFYDLNEDFFTQSREAVCNFSILEFFHFTDSITQELECGELSSLYNAEDNLALTAYIQTLAWSKLLWRTFVPMQGDNESGIIVTNNGCFVFGNQEEKSFLLQICTNRYGILYPIIGESQIVALCFYEEGSLFDNANQVTIDANITIPGYENMGCVPQGVYPIHQSSLHDFHYILLEENIL